MRQPDLQGHAVHECRGARVTEPHRGLPLDRAPRRRRLAAVQRRRGARCRQDQCDHADGQ